MKRYVALIAFVGVVGSASAVNLSPGGFVLTPGTTEALRPELAGGVILDEFVNFRGVRSYSNEYVIWGELEERIVRENVSRNLDFYYRITNYPTSIDSIERLTLTGFTGSKMDVNFRRDALGDVGSVFADRSASGEQVGFSFLPDPFGFGLVTPGTSSSFLFIRTNAREYMPGTASLIDGSVVATIDAHSPLLLPEPMSIGVLGAGLVVLLRRRRSK